MKVAGINDPIMSLIKPGELIFLIAFRTAFFIARVKANYGCVTIETSVDLPTIFFSTAFTKLLK
jgi:hypothetical protein